MQHLVVHSCHLHAHGKYRPWIGLICIARQEGGIFDDLETRGAYAAAISDPPGKPSATNATVPDRRPLACCYQVMHDATTLAMTEAEQATLLHGTELGLEVSGSQSECSSIPCFDNNMHSITWKRICAKRHIARIISMLLRNDSGNEGSPHVVASAAHH